MIARSHTRAMDQLELQIGRRGLERSSLAREEIGLIGFGTKHLNHMQQLVRLERFCHVDDGA